ncbi:MAG TPA: zinc-binding dehydrogenase [Thermoplasmata archaeon]|nr:zinc-binding dehydrogenase [Thermoplasmata archaeon]
MMRGFGFAQHGGLERLQYVEVNDPTPGPDEVRVRVGAAAFNRLDRFTLAGIPGVPIELPHVLGSDGSGVVDRVGEGVSDLPPGTKVLLNPGIWDATCPACRAGQEALCRNYRILGEHVQGTMAPFVVVPRRNVHPLPERMTFAEGAAAPLVFLTSWRALKTVGAVQPGERVAIVGAGGGIPTAAVQVAKLLGARVAVVSRSMAKEPRARTLGADAFLVYSEERPLDRVLWEWSEKTGVDVVLDSVGSPTLGRAVRSLARAGRAVVIGASAGPAVELDVRTLFWRQASVRGSTMSSRGEFQEVYDQLARGRLKAVVDSTFGFEQAADAFRRFDAPDLFGKIVVLGPSI